MAFALLTGLSALAQAPPFPVNNDAIIYADSPVYAGHTYQDIVNYACPPASTPSIPDPPGGCTIYATSVNASRTIGTLDPGSKVVTLYLGSFTYNIDHIVLRKGLKVIGMGGSDAGTILQSVNASSPVFTIPQVNNTPATDVQLYGLRMQGATGNTNQFGIFAYCASLTNAGLWHSSFEDLVFLNFQGSAIGLFGPTSSVVAADQFLSFRNILAFRPPGGGPDLRIEGAVGQVDCINCQLDGWGMGAVPNSPIDGWSNIFIGNLTSGGTQAPYSIHFFNLTSQAANQAVQIQGGTHISFIGSHFEALSGAYQLSAGTGLQVRSIWMAHDHSNGNVGIDPNVHGNGFIVFAQNASDVVLQSASMDGTPDRFIAGSSAAAVSILNGTSPAGSLVSNFAGSLHVTGTITKAGGSFKIDHPLDPKNKYLSHSFVESPDMMNVYNGVVTLDSKGRATVKLPSYFEALNRDFRYQLTCMGGFAPVFVSHEVKGNSFQIGGGKPGLKVSWQVTGIRHDAFANAHRIPVEEEKPPSDLGQVTDNQ